MQIIKESAPHLRRKDNMATMMLDVIIAFLPTVIFSLVIFKLDALRNILLSIATMELCEFVFVLIKNRIPYDGNKHTLKEHFEKQRKAYTINNFLVPLVSALIFAMIMPASSNPGSIIYVALILGSAFGLIIGKLVFGGTGKNIFNPAAVGMVFAKLCFGSYYTYPDNSYYAYSSNAAAGEITTGATPLGYLNYTDKTFDFTHYSILDLFLGKTPGTIGEIFKVTILVGLIYMIIRHTIDWRIPLLYLGVFTFDMLIVGSILYAAKGVNVFSYVMYNLLSGGLIFGATFMATDPVTAPITRPGKMMYGAILGSLTVIIRLFAALPEGVAFSILLANISTSVLDYYKWSTDRYNWKNLLSLALIVLLPLLIIIWATCVRVF